MSENKESADDVEFEWMKPQGAKAAQANEPQHHEAPQATPEKAAPAASKEGAHNVAAPQETATNDADAKPASQRYLEPQESAKDAPAKAASDERSTRDSVPNDAPRSTANNEPLPTSMLQVRPPQSEVDRRTSGREEAAALRPVLPRIFQVLLAICYPVVLLVLAIRVVTTPLFLWVEYYRPGFPADSFGFSQDDRLTYGSYTLQYLLNFTGPRFLGDLVGTDHRQLFAPGEVSHMADVKGVFQMAFIVGSILGLIALISIIYLARRRSGAVRRGLFAGSIVTLVIIIALGVLGFMGWDTFFTDFHGIFFKAGTWTFHENDTLIRLFPDQFWMDAGLAIGVIVLLVASLTFAFTWPTRSRREAAARALNPAQGRRVAN